MIILNKEQLLTLKNFTKTTFSEWFGFKVSAKNHRELLASLTNSKSDAHLCQRLKDGPVKIEFYLKDTNFENLFSKIYKIPLPDDARKSLEAFLHSDLLEMIPTPDISFNEFGESISLKKALKESFEYRKENQNFVPERKILGHTNNSFVDELPIEYQELITGSKKELKQSIDDKVKELYLESKSNLEFNEWQLNNSHSINLVTSDLNYLAPKKRISNHLKNGCNLECIYTRLSDIKYDDVKNQLLDKYNEDDLIVSWQIWQFPEDTYADVVKNEKGYLYKKVFLAIYSKGEFIPIGAASSKINVIKNFSLCDLDIELENIVSSIEEKKELVNFIVHYFPDFSENSDRFIVDPFIMEEPSAEDWFNRSYIHWDEIRDEIWANTHNDDKFWIGKIKNFSVKKEFNSLEYLVLERLNLPTEQSSIFTKDERYCEDNARRLKIPYSESPIITIIDSDLITQDENVLSYRHESYQRHFATSLLIK